MTLGDRPVRALRTRIAHSTQVLRLAYTQPPGACPVFDMVFVTAPVLLRTAATIEAVIWGTPDLDSPKYLEFRQATVQLRRLALGLTGSLWRGSLWQYDHCQSQDILDQAARRHSEVDHSCNQAARFPDPRDHSVITTA